MTSETSENTIFFRFYFTRCYVMLSPRMSLCRILVPVLKWEHETGLLSVFTRRHGDHVGVPKQRNGQPCWCPQLILWELNSFLMQTFSFVLVEKHAHWSREWKHSIVDQALVTFFDNCKFPETSILEHCWVTFSIWSCKEKQLIILLAIPKDKLHDTTTLIFLVSVYNQSILMPTEAPSANNFQLGN